MKKMTVITFSLCLGIILSGCGCSDKKDDKKDVKEKEAVIEVEKGITDEYIESTDEFKNVLTKDEIKKYKDVLLFKNDNPRENYMDDIVLVGDSVSYGYKVFDKFDKNRVWAEGSADTRAVMDKPFGVDANGNSVTIAEALKSVKPKYLYSMLGTNGVSWMDKDYFKETYVTFIKSCQSASPDTQFIIVSIPPITTKRVQEGGFASNEKIDEYNKLLLDVAKENNCKYLYAAEVQKDTDGGLKPEYTSGDGIHWYFDTYDLTLDYIKNHAIEE